MRAKSGPTTWVLESAPAGDLEANVNMEEIYSLFRWLGSLELMDAKLCSQSPVTVCFPKSSQCRLRECRQLLAKA